MVKLSSVDMHTCSNGNKGREASIGWLSQRVKDIMKEDPALSAEKLQKRLEKQYNIELTYWKVWTRKKTAMNALNGTWEESFTTLWRFKAALEESCPGSIVEIDCKRINGKCTFQGCLCLLEHVLMGFYLAVDHILVLIPPTSLESIKDIWLQPLPLMDTAGCIQLPMAFF
jgi:hypothetical protein